MDVLVVGAGLAGLTAALDLHRAGMAVRVVESRARVGGRMMTVRPDELGARAWFDLGATWHWSDQPGVRALGEDLGLGVFPQFRQGRALVEETVDLPPSPTEVPPPAPAELRFVGGAQSLCERLAAQLPPGAVSLQTAVVEVAEDRDGLAISVDGGDGGHDELAAPFVVVAVPPRLASQHIRITPALPEDVVEVMRATPTWMGAAVKCVAVYESAFWTTAGRSGQAFSRVGPLTEVHDASNDDRSVAGVWGFVSADHAYRDLDTGDRVELVLAQLGRLFGPAAADPIQYFERDWSGDPNTNDEVWWVDGDLLPYGHPALARPQCGGRLVWAGTETAAVGGGHMEGAVRSGRRAARTVVDAAGLG